MIITADIIALQNSIDHWYTNLMLAYAGEIDIHDVSDLECALCNLTRSNEENGEIDNCRTCALVKLECCEASCEGSPYHNVRAAINCATRCDSPNWERVADCVIDEILFLENALEKALSERLGVCG